MREINEYSIMGGKQPLGSFEAICNLPSIENALPDCEVIAIIGTDAVESLMLCQPSPQYLADVRQVLVVEALHAALPIYVQHGYSIAVEPFKSRRGTCAILQDDFGTRICLIELSAAKPRTQSSLALQS